MRQKTQGVWYTVAAYTLWGLLPVYWKALKQVPSVEILAHRILWSFVFLFGLISLQRRFSEFREVFSIRRNRITFFTTAAIICSNWLIYIWAINADHVVDASLGYFINPLVSVLLGILILRERLDFWQVLSLTLATVGVLYLTFNLGKIPWISLSLALTFGFYGLLRKRARVESLAGLTAETAILLPSVLIYITILAFKGTGALGRLSTEIHLFLIGAGVVTATPLLLFNSGVRKIPLSTVGFLQYFSPSIALLLGVFAYKEPFTPAHQVSFGFIWTGLLIYSLSTSSLLPKVNLNFFRKK